MSKKNLVILAIPAALILGGFLYLQFYLRKSNAQDTTDKSQATMVNNSPGAEPDTLGGKKVSAMDLRPLFIERMQQLLKKSSNGLYNLTVGDMKVDVLASTISLHNVTVRPEGHEDLKSTGSLPASVFNIAFKSLVIEGVNLDDAITSKTIDYKLVRLVNPVIRISQQEKKPKENKEDFSQRFLKEMQKLSIQKLVVEGGTVVVQDQQAGTVKKMNNVQVLMNNILLDSATRTDKNRFLFAKEARLDFTDYHTQSKNGLYDFKVGSVSVRAPQKLVVLKNLSYASAVSKEVFQKKSKVAKEIYGLHLPSLTISGVDWWQAFNGKQMAAKEVKTNGGKLSVYFSRSLPPANKMGNFPNQMVAKLPVDLAVDRLRITDLDISYQEYNPLSQQHGTLYMDNANMDIRNVNNGAKNKLPMTVTGTSLFMHQVPVSANFRFDMTNPENGGFTASLRTGKNFDGKVLNAFAMPLGLMKLEKGEVQKLEATIKGDENQAAGTVLLLYNDLKLAMLEKDSDQKALDKKDATTLLANLFVLKKDNPKGDNEPRKEPAQFKRDPTGGFMHLVWKSTLTGILKTIGAPEKIAYKKAGKQQ